jgi:hypothetical protein
MTAEQASHVFERFYRTDDARTRTRGGSRRPAPQPHSRRPGPVHRRRHPAAGAGGGAGAGVVPSADARAPAACSGVLGCGSPGGVSGPLRNKATAMSAPPAKIAADTQKATV